MKHIVKASGISKFVKVLITKPSFTIAGRAQNGITNRELKSFKGSYRHVTEAEVNFSRSELRHQ